MRDAEGNQEAVIYGDEVTEVLEGGVRFGVKIRRGDEFVRRLCNLAYCVEDVLCECGVVLEQCRDLCDLDGCAAGLAGVDEEEGELWEAVEGEDPGLLSGFLFLVEDGFAACGDGVVDARGVAVDAHFADEGPSVYPLDLELRLLRGLVLVWAAEGADLEEEGGADAHGDTGTAAEAGS